MLLPANPEAELVEKIRRDPVGFMGVFFNEEPIGKQRSILDALRDPTVDEIYVPSCHDSGKTFICARCLLWWLMAFPHESKVVSTAPTWQQIRMLLWREVASAYKKAEGAGKPIGGELLTTRLDLGPQWYAIGLGVDPHQALNATTLQGHHAPHILVIIDEADGVAESVWNAVDGLTTSGHVKVLAIGNPLDPTSTFKKRHDLALSNPRHRVIRISDEDVLPYSEKFLFLLQRRWVEDRRRDWGEGSALWMGKVKAQWPEQAVDTLIPMRWLMRAMGRPVKRGLRTYGADIAGEGLDRTARTLLEGGQHIWTRFARQEDTVQTVGRIAPDLKNFEPAVVRVDETGIGKGVVDQLRAMGFTVVGVNNGASARDAERFENLGSEMWWQTREGFEQDVIGISTDDPETADLLMNELNRPKWWTAGKGRIHVDKYGLGQGHTTRTLGPEQRAARSPDLADSFVLAFAAARNELVSGIKPRETRHTITERLE